MTGRLPVAIALLTLLVATAAALAATTPWRPLAAGRLPRRSRVSAAADFTPVELARCRAYHSAVDPAAYLDLAVGFAVAAVVGFTPLGAGIVGGIPGGWVAQAALGTFALTALGWIVSVPTGLWIHREARRHRLTAQGLRGWLGDRLRGLGLSAVFAAAAALVFFALTRQAPGSWWLWSGLVGAAAVCLLSYLVPVIIEPVFNRFTPMPAGAARSALLALAARDRVDVSDVLVADASRRTTALNAYVSGYGATRRIVVYDTLLRTATEAELRLVVAHELGHARRRDVVRGTLIAALGVGIGACAAYLLLSWPALVARSAARGAGDPRSLGLLLALANVGGLLTSPLQQLVSRRVEACADVHALELTGDVAAFVATQRALALANLSRLDPSAASYLLWWSHPTAAQRIALARDWQRARAWPVPLSP